MKQWACNVCLTEFSSEGAGKCPKCGTTDIVCIAENTSQALPCAEFCDNEAEIKAILGELCIDAYDCTFRGVEWLASIDRTMERLRPFLKSEKVTV